MNKAMLVLSDGTAFEGVSFGAEGETLGEVVFNTSMTGYQEILTDPSYKGQIVTMTCPQIGNYGVNAEDVESGAPYVEGFIVKEYLPYDSNWRSHASLGEYLKSAGITAIEGIDTRALTRHLREHVAVQRRAARSGLAVGLATTAKGVVCEDPNGVTPPNPPTFAIAPL